MEVGIDVDIDMDRYECAAVPVNWWSFKEGGLVFT